MMMGLGLREDLYDEISAFQYQIGMKDKQQYHFPDLVETYFANYIVRLAEGYYLPDDPKDVLDMNKDDLIKYLSHNHRYIHSMYQDILGCNLYYSLDNSTWIILSNTLIELPILESLLENFRLSIIRPLELQNVSVVITSTFDTIIFNQGKTVTYPFEHLTKTQGCVAAIYAIKNSSTLDTTTSTRVEKNLISTRVDVLVVIDQVAQYIFFKDYSL